MTRIALVASQAAGELFGDGPLLEAAFERLGIETEILAWGKGPEWGGFDAVVLRNTFDYVQDREGFLDWAGEVAAQTRLANPLDVLRWNTDKRYLRDLEAAGIPTVPTLWVKPGQPIPVPDWAEYVVKPSVSCGARLAARYCRGDDPTDHIRRINAARGAAMLQPYVASVDNRGETGTYVFGDEVSHAIGKGPVLAAGQPPVDDSSLGFSQAVEPAPIDPKLAAFARRVLAAAPEVVYARVDTAPDADGDPMLLELEVAEPYLFLELAPQGADCFARAIDTWLRRPPGD